MLRLERRPALGHLADVLTRALPGGVVDHQPEQRSEEYGELVLASPVHPGPQYPGLWQGDAVPAGREGEDPVPRQARHDPAVGQSLRLSHKTSLCSCGQ